MIISGMTIDWLIDYTRVNINKSMININFPLGIDFQYFIIIGPVFSNSMLISCSVPARIVFLNMGKTKNPSIKEKVWVNYNYNSISYKYW